MQGRDLPDEHDHPHARRQLRRRRHVSDAPRRPPASRSAAARRRASRPARPTPTARRPAVCSNGSCGLKPDGAVCGGGGECASGICAQGVCCMTACAGTCMSCALAGSAGTCRPVAAGTRDPAGQCRDQGAASCGRTGFCDGAGGCQLYAAGTQCAPPSCPAGATTATLARTLRRRRHLQARDDASRARPTLATARPAAPPAPATATAQPATSATPARAARSGSARSARAGARMRQRQLRRRRLLLVGELRQLPVVQRRRHRGQLQAGPGRRDGAARRLRRRPALRLQRHVRRHRRLPADARRHQLRRAVVQRIDARRRPALRRRRHLPAEPGQLRAVRLRDRTPARRPARQPRIASPATPAGRLVHQPQGQRHRLRRGHASASAATARKASAAGRRLRGPATRARSPASRGPARRRPTARVCGAGIVRRPGSAPARIATCSSRACACRNAGRLRALRVRRARRTDASPAVPRDADCAKKHTCTLGDAGADVCI